MKKFTSASIIVVLILALLPVVPTLAQGQGQQGGRIESLEREVDPSAIQVPRGYTVEVLTIGLTYPTDITFGSNGEMYVAEAGGHFYGSNPRQAPPARILRVLPDGSTEVIFDNNVPFEAIRDADTFRDIPEGLIGPVEGITFNPDNGLLYIAHRTRYSTLDPETGEFNTIIDGLPVWGIFHNSKAIFDADGHMVFEVSAQANAGYLDRPFMEVIAFYNKPEKHEIPCEDVTLTGRDLPVPNLFTQEQGDTELTGIYVPFGERTRRGQTIQGEFICNGAFYRANPDGEILERLSWGFRDPYHYEFSPDGRLIATDNGAEAFGTRPIYDDWDRIWAVEEGDLWYGWPEYMSGLPITDDRFRLPEDPNFQGEPFEHHFALTEETRQRLLRGEEAPRPLVRLEPHIGAQGFAFIPEEFGLAEDPENEILLAEFGTLQLFTTRGATPPGFQVSRVNIETGERVPFMTNRPGHRPLSASDLSQLRQGGGLERPLRPEFGPDGAFYLVDFGVLNSFPEDARQAFPNTGVIWKVTHTGAAAQQGAEVRLRDLVRNPDEFTGETVTVTGPVGEELDREAFTLTTNGQEILVVGDRQAIPSNLPEQVEVQGQVQENFNAADIEDELGVTLNQDVEQFEGDAFILAEDVQEAQQGQQQGQQQQQEQDQQGQQQQQQAQQDVEVRLQREVERFCQRFEEDFAATADGGDLFQDVQQFCERFEGQAGARQEQGQQQDRGEVGRRVIRPSDVTQDRELFFGRETTVRGEVGDQLGDQGFVVQDEDGDLLVLTPPGIDPLDLQGNVEVTGRINQFNREDVEEDLGVTLDEEQFGEFEDQPFITGETIATDEDEDSVFGEEEDDQVFGGEEEDSGFFDDLFGGSLFEGEGDGE